MTSVQLDILLGQFAMVGAASVGAFALYRFVGWAYRLAKRLEKVHNAVLYQLCPNGGTSLVDRVSQIERHLQLPSPDPVSSVKRVAG